MAHRANWKGVLKVADVIVPVALHTAVSTSERIAFHTINRATGHRARREFVDGETGKPVPREYQAMGYAVGKDDYFVLQPAEIAAAIPESDKTLSVEAFVGLDAVDQVYLATPYYLAPADRTADEAFALLRDEMLHENVGAIARTVLYRRVRTFLIRAQSGGMIATTLNFDYEARPAETVFKSIADAEVKREMLDLAEHIIKTKLGAFDPSQFEDRYEHALADLVKAKLEGKLLAPPRRPKREPVVDLMAALRESASVGKDRASKRPPSRRRAG